MEFSLKVILVGLCVVVCTEGQGRFGKIIKEKAAVSSSGPDYSIADHALGIPRVKISKIESCFCRKFGQKVANTDATECLCVCKEGFTGSPPNCTVGVHLWDACYSGNPCGPDSECELDDDGDRQCSCAPGFAGRPPHCRSGRRRRAVCKRCGPNARCVTLTRVENDLTVCKCEAGYVGDPPHCTAGPMLLNMCDPYPCGPNSRCANRTGVATCSCLPGYRGEPPSCQPGPELWRMCFKERPCDVHSVCDVDVQEKGPVCSECPTVYQGRSSYCLPQEDD